MRSHQGSTKGEQWRISVDSGGTFTDCLAWTPSGARSRAKVLSTSAIRGRLRGLIAPDTLLVDLAGAYSPEPLQGLQFRGLGASGPIGIVQGFDPDRSILQLDRGIARESSSAELFELHSSEPAPLFAARLLTGTAQSASMPGMELRIATTRGTNALLERRGEPTALFITRGFGDLLEIGTQQRPDLFAIDIIKPVSLAARVVEVDERIGADGTVIRAMDLETLRRDAAACLDAGIRTAAVALLHADCHPSHELEVAGILRSMGFDHVTSSHQVAPFIRILNRAETAMADAYLAALIDRYLDAIRAGMSDGRVLVMTSAGGLVEAGSFRPKDSLLSGPAGGVAGAAAAGRVSGFRRVLSLDMGGTSTDVARIDGSFSYVFEHEVGGVHVAAPALDIHTVAAGGGSICRYRHGRLEVGPESAGADPGPACYGVGGPLTLTDVNLLLGWIDPSGFEIPIDREAAERRLTQLLDEVAAHDERPMSRIEVLQGLLEIANVRMADAIRQVSVRQGYDPAEYALVAFGGAGPQHACGVARHLGVKTIIVPREASVLSAAGLAQAAREQFAERQVALPLKDFEQVREEICRQLTEEATRPLLDSDVPSTEIEVRRTLFTMRYRGQSATLQIEPDDEHLLGERFENEYRRTYGHILPGREVEVDAVRIVVSVPPPKEVGGEVAQSRTAPLRAVRARSVCIGPRTGSVPAFDRQQLCASDVIRGPAVVDDAYSTTVIEDGWALRVDAAGALIIEKMYASSESAHIRAVSLELFWNRLGSVAAEMGGMLQRTALSTNVRERLDFSCAVLDADGSLLVNAPHIPVHLGSLGACVRAVRQVIAFEPGDVVVTNHPGHGGSHLPDVTVITPVFDSDQELLAFVANRAHHAEIGGRYPGSMSPDAQSLAEEGVVLAPMHLVKGGRPCWDLIDEQLRGAEFPSRAIGENLADLRAQVAANERGRSSFIQIVEAYGPTASRAFMRQILDRGQETARNAIGALSDGIWEASESLDDGSPICVKIEINGQRALIDFSGTAGEHPHNLNATAAIVQSAIMYVQRLLIGEPIPLNDGLLKPIEVSLPRGLLNPEFIGDLSKCPAVAGGNVETSQRLVDTLLKALKLCACSQGTMNNLIIGNDRFSYYETICGGAGASRSAPGASAVQVHMTNTRITDAEVLERRYPIRVERFAIRRGSGGSGGPQGHRGGDGVIRELLLLEPVVVSMLSEHRTSGPYGLGGGQAGAPGTQRLIRADGRVDVLPHSFTMKMAAGDRLIIETPGGGGCGQQN